MSDLEVITFRPEPAQYAWTFGGAAPAMRIRTPAVLEVYTEDCFAGRVRSKQDLVSQVCEFPFLNPQTGPFYIEGAEPGNTVAVHFVSIEPGQVLGGVDDRAAVRRADRDAPDRAAAGPAARGGLAVAARRGRADLSVQRAAGLVRGGPADGPDARHDRGSAGEPRGAQRAGTRRVRREHGHAGDARRGHLLSRRQREGALLSLGDGHARRARARPAASRWSAR